MVIVETEKYFDQELNEWAYVKPVKEKRFRKSQRELLC